MKFLRQIKYEIWNILKSKFLLVIGILVVATGIAMPVITLFTQMYADGVKPMPMGGIYYAKEATYSNMKYGDNGNQEPITVDGITISNNNPFYWNISALLQEKNAMENDKVRFSSPKALDLAIEMIDVETHYYVRIAQYVTKPQDYRRELAERSFENLYDKFIYEHADVKEDVLMEAVNYKRGMTPEIFKKKYIQITPEARQAAYIKADENLNTVFAVAEGNNFPKYIDLRIKQENDQIASLKENIAIQEQTIVENPSQEENINLMIVDLKKQIALIETNNIPILQYRLEKNIIPGENIWQNAALSDIEGSRNQLSYLSIVSVEKFSNDINLIQQYRNYQKYVNSVQTQINQQNNTVLIAQKSLDADKPDMKYVMNSVRNRTVLFLDYSVIIALFAILLGGWIIASEFQQGTIRLLMIRPKTRTKILMSKFVAAFLVCLAIYIAGSLLNIVTNGICFGFSDYAYPNYTIIGESNFFVYYLPKFLICIITILFAFTVAFMLSVVSKNIAVSIAVPIVCFIGSTILMAAFAYRAGMEWIAYTPMPFVQLSSFFVPYSSVQQMIQNGVPLSMPYGIMLLLVLSAICTVISIIVFKKTDIAN